MILRVRIMRALLLSLCLICGPIGLAAPSNATQSSRTSLHLVVRPAAVTVTPADPRATVVVRLTSTSVRSISHARLAYAVAYPVGGDEIAHWTVVHWSPTPGSSECGPAAGTYFCRLPRIEAGARSRWTATVSLPREVQRQMTGPASFSLSVVSFGVRRNGSDISNRVSVKLSAEDDNQLPYTGSVPASIPVSVAAILLIGGASMIVLVRRRAASAATRRDPTATLGGRRGS